MTIKLNCLYLLNKIKNNLIITTMAKGKDIKKDAKKAPAKTAKEKKQEKKEKKEKKK